ncbi:hypothetical protein [Glaciibacter psychrotolerans]|uniref:Fatty acid desaturase n=1 Tax=Glaciibacter psychrotolerans TaxID=670054 RepID=A0A7Z0EC80_9MICO|nr:hypothetical protein [Leifsonia psychrotolerans]NYJ18993.1 fatty acid desaturase [Leifsonia psychrotolerans]
MSLVTTVLAEAGHVALPLPILVYGIIPLVLFIALGAVLWTYRDVANRHQAKADAYAAAHGGAPGHSGH